jgi:hypothetical protein
MTHQDDGVRAVLQKRFGRNEKEIERMLGCYVGVHMTVRGYFRKWLTVHLAEHASWMLDYINIRLIADVATATGRVVTLPAKLGPGQIAVYVFVCKTEK